MFIFIRTYEYDVWVLVSNEPTWWPKKTNTGTHDGFPSSVPLVLLSYTVTADRDYEETTYVWSREEVAASGVWRIVASCIIPIVCSCV